MESVAVGRIDTDRGSGRLPTIVSRWIAQNGETRRRRPMAEERGLPATLRSEARPVSPCGTEHPVAGSGPSALSTKAIQERIAYGLMGLILAGICFFMGAIWMDRIKSPKPYVAVAVAGEIPSKVFAERNMYRERLSYALTTVGDMEMGMDLAMQQLHACHREVGR